MLNTYPYLCWLIIFVLIPSIILWVIFWKFLKQYLHLILFITLCSFIWGFLFDTAGINLRVWFYLNDLNIYFINIPLEEYINLLLLPQGLTIILLLIRRKIYG